MTISPDRPYGEPAPPPRRGRALPGRVVALAALVVVVLVLTSTSRVRTWWAHRLHDITGASKPADFAVGLFVGLLPVFGVLIGAVVSRRQGRRAPGRLLRMLLFGALGFIATYLLAPSPANAIAHRSTTRVFEHAVPGYLPGVFTGVGIWLAALVLGLLRARAWWRSVTGRRPGRRPPDDSGSHRVIDI